MRHSESAPADSCHFAATYDRRTWLPNSCIRNVALATALAAACVLCCFADVFFGPYLSKTFRPNPPPGWVFALAAAAATLAVIAVVTWPRCQASLIRVLAVTAFI